MAIIPGTNGNDTLTGGDDADSISGLNGADSLIGNGGNDSIFGGSGNDTLRGGNGADLLDGGANTDQLFGDAGDDTLLGGSGNDALDGGADNDTVSFAAVTAGMTISLAAGTATGDGTDTLANIENAIGGTAADSITGSTGANRLEGGAGNDTLDGGAGNDTLTGGAGTDTVDYASATGSGVTVDLLSNTATGGGGTDALAGFENVSGSALNDQLTGNSGNNVLDGGAGNDTLAGGRGNDTLSGGDGADRVFAGQGDDVVNGGAGDDIIRGDADPAGTFTFRVYNKDFTAANGQASTIETGTLALEGTTTDFNLRNMLAAARGTTPDVNPEDFGVILTSTYTAATAGVYRFTTTSDDGSTLRLFDANGTPLTFANQTGGTSTFLDNDFHQGATTRFGDVTLQAGQTYTMEIRVWENLGQEVLAASVTPPGGTTQNLLGNAGLGSDPNNAGNDTINAGDGNDTVFGEAGNDVLSGGAGADVLDGGAGTDSLSGDAGDDTLTGGAGNDTLSGGDGADALDGGTGDDTILFGTGNDTVTGGDGNDLIDDIGGGQLSGTNLVFGGAGNDTIFAGNDNDTVYGGADNDQIFGEEGNDSLFGDDGNDTLTGGGGDDALDGGAGADVLSGGDGRDTVVGGIGDTVDGGEGGTDEDTLDLRAFGKAGTNILFGGGNGESGTVEFLDGNGAVIGTMSFSNIETVVPCFTPGVSIATLNGPRPVETLRVGDRVLTRDSGFQAIRWIGRRALTAAEAAAQPGLAPVRIARGALGPDLPERDLIVSPQHRMLITGPRAEMIFGEREVLVAALHLVGRPGISRMAAGPVTYLHLLFDRHEIVQAEGAWSESFQPGARTLRGMEDAVRAELLSLFPDLSAGADYAAARLSLKAHEARVLLAA